MNSSVTQEKNLAHQQSKPAGGAHGNNSLASLVASRKGFGLEELEEYLYILKDKCKEMELQTKAESDYCLGIQNKLKQLQELTYSHEANIKELTAFQKGVERKFLDLQGMVHQSNENKVS